MKLELHREGAVCVVDTTGGEILSYRTPTGLSCLWNGDESVWPGHSPHLFPIIGTLPGGRYQLDGRSYCMGKHGFLRGTEFAVQSRTPESVTLIRRETEESLACYPFRFSFCVTHTLRPDGFETSYQIINHSTDAMPFCVGGHPAFACPVSDDESFADYELLLPGLNDFTALRAESDAPLSRCSCVRLPVQNGALPLSHAFLGDCVWIFEQTACHQAILRSRKHAYSAQLTFDDFPNFALWTFGAKQAGYLCIEPWHGLPCLETDGPALTDKPACIVLAPHEQKRLSYRVRFCEGPLLSSAEL